MSENPRTEEQEGAHTEKRSDAEEFRDVVRAMEKGDDSVRNRMALFLLSGRGGAEVDPERAVELLKEAAQNGDGEACWMLGLCFEYGMGIEQDIEQAEVLYQQSSLAKNTVGSFLAKIPPRERGSQVLKVADYGLFLELPSPEQ